MKTRHGSKSRTKDLAAWGLSQGQAFGDLGFRGLSASTTMHATVEAYSDSPGLSQITKIVPSDL